MEPTCEVIERFRSEDVLSAVSVVNKIFLLFTHECCVRREGEDSISSIVSCDDDDRMQSISVVGHAVWVVTRQGLFFVVDAVSEEVRATEHTHLTVGSVSVGRDCVCVVFESNPTEVALLSEDKGALSVTKTLSADNHVKCATSEGQSFIICTRSSLLVSINGEGPSIYPEGRGSAARLVGEDAWIGLDNGMVAVVRDKVLRTYTSDASSQITSVINREDGAVWTFSEEGVAVAWSIRDLTPIGSFNLARNLKNLVPGGTYKHTTLCGIAGGDEVVRWQLVSDPCLGGSEGKDRNETRYLRHLCDILCSHSEEELEDVCSQVPGSFLPVSFSHVALPYLPEALRSLSETRSLLCGSFEGFGFSSVGLKDDVAYLIEQYRSLREACESACERLTKNFGLEDIRALTDLPELPNRLASVVGRVVEHAESSASRERSEYIFKKYIADLKSELERRTSEISALQSDLERVQRETKVYTTRLNDAEQLIGSQKIQIEFLDSELSSANERRVVTENDLQINVRLLGEAKLLLEERTNAFSAIQSQLEQELEDLTQNEVTLLGRLRAYQSQVVASKVSIRSFLRSISRGAKPAELVEQMKEALSSWEGGTIES